jgi:hypothetical protein
MSLIAVTRFNNETWHENKQYKRLHNFNGCLYATPVKIASHVPHKQLIFVVEMDISKHENTNYVAKMRKTGILTPKKCHGIGLICNHARDEQYCRIYTDKNYNRYTYKSVFRLSRNIINKYDSNIMNMLDILLTTGKGHMQRGSGIQIVSFEKLDKEFKSLMHSIGHNNLYEYLNEVFSYHFKIEII